MAKKAFILLLLLLPFSAYGQADSIVINEIAWPVESAYAADHGLKMGTIVINEVAWMGSSVQDVDSKQWWRYEWLELFNVKDSPLQIDGWTVELYRDKLDFRISLNGTIPSQGYFLIGASDKIQNIDLNYKNLAGKFNNSGQRVVLKNSAGEVVDEVDATSGWPAGDNESKRTMERTEVAWQTSKDSGGTPKAHNSSGKLEQPAAEKPVALKPSETKKDPSGSLFNASTFFIAFPGALLAGALALGARRFLLKRRFDPAQRKA